MSADMVPRMKAAGAYDSLLMPACSDMSVRCMDSTTTESTHTFACTQAVSELVAIMAFRVDGTNVTT